MTVNDALKMICDHRAKVKRHQNDWHEGYYDGLTAALLLLSEEKPADTDNPVWETESRMTLTEFAVELKNILRFRWLTLDYTGYITLWNNKPKYTADWKGSKKTWQRGNDPLCGMSGYIFPNAVGGALDLEEYADENGNIDYSKCIVEVE